MCDDEIVRKPEAHKGKKLEEKKGAERNVEVENAEGSNVEGKSEESNPESRKAEERKVESKKHEVGRVECKKAEEREVETKKDEGGRVESKKAEERKVESKKQEGGRVERKKVEERKVKSKEDEGGRVENKKAEERGVEEWKRAEETQLALNPKPRVEDPNSKLSKKAKRIIPTRGGLAMYPRYPSEDTREEVNDKVRRMEALSGSEMNIIAVSFSSEDELTGARYSLKNPSESKLNLSKPRKPYTPRKANISEDELEQSRATNTGELATDEEITMLDSGTPDGDGARTMTPTLRPTSRGRGASRPRNRNSTTQDNPSTPRRTAGGFEAVEDENSTMPVTRASRYQTRAAQPIASEPAPYHTYPPRRFLEVNVQRFELPDDRPQGPGNLWACQRPGCGYREHNAVSAEGLERVRSHIQHHADEDAKREPFFKNPFRDNPTHPSPVWAYVIH